MRTVFRSVGRSARWFAPIALAATVVIGALGGGIHHLALGSSPPPAFGGACTVSPVNVGYSNAFTSGAYRVSAVTVRNISMPSCAGASLTVTLSSAFAGLYTTNPPATINSASMTILIAPGSRPISHDVTKVDVAIAGGTTPVPPECSGMTFSTTQVGSTGNDIITGTNGNDLIYTLSGTDTVSGLQGNDCINGGSNASDFDTIADGNGNDVILAGGARVTLNAGNGNDTVKLGNGNNDSVVLGNGNDRIWLGTGNNDSITVGNGGSTIYTGGRTATSTPATAGATTTRVGTGVVKIYGGKGNDTIYLGNGSGPVDGGGGTNVCHVPSLKNNKYTITNCTVVSP